MLQQQQVIDLVGSDAQTLQLPNRRSSPLRDSDTPFYLTRDRDVLARLNECHHEGVDVFAVNVLGKLRAA